MQDSPILLIVLNGASSSGKTTIAHALLQVLEEPQIYTGLDDILERVQPFGSEHGGMFHRLARPWRTLWFQLTDGRLKLFQQLHREVVAHYRMGKNIIVDTALMDRRALLDAAECFAPLGGFLIGIKPPLEVSERWEAARGDRNPGHAREHYDLIHAHGIYDLALDPSQMTPEECARVILNRVNGPAPDAFQRIIKNR
jgi:chloramphenicol 3-O phosphotransferase